MSRKLSPSDLAAIAKLLSDNVPPQSTAIDAAYLAKKTAAEVAAHLSSQIFEIHEGLAVTNTEVKNIVEALKEKKVRCEDHSNRIRNLEKGTWKIVGAATATSSILSVIAGWWAGRHP